MQLFHMVMTGGDRYKVAASNWEYAVPRGGRDAAALFVAGAKLGLLVAGEVSGELAGRGPARPGAPDQAPVLTFPKVSPVEERSGKFLKRRMKREERT